MREKNQLRILVVDAEPACSQQTCSAVRKVGLASVTAVHSGQAAVEELRDGTDVLIIDARLPDMPATAVIEAAFQLPVSPRVLATGDCIGPAEVFRMARAGVLDYLKKPVSSEELAGVLERTTDLKALGRLLKPLVGHYGLKDIQHYVRTVLISEALTRTNGSRRSAARVLRVTRPAVQKMLRDCA